MRSNRRVRRLALVGIVGPILWWVLIAVNGAITPGYSHVEDFISTLGGVSAPNALLQQLNFAIFGGSIIAFALGLHARFDDGRRPRIGTVLVGGFGVGVVLAGVFQQDLADVESTTNLLHNLVSVVAFLAGIGGIALVTHRLIQRERWPSYPRELPVTLAIVLTTFGAFIYSMYIDAGYIGLTQRAFIGAMSLWVVGQSARLYRSR